MVLIMMKTFLFKHNTAFFGTSVFCDLQADVLHVVRVLATQTTPHTLLICPCRQQMAIFRNKITDKSSLIGSVIRGQIFSSMSLLDVELPNIH